MYRPVCFAAGMFIAGIVLGQDKGELLAIICSVIFSVIIFGKEKQLLKYLGLCTVSAGVFMFSFIFGCNIGEKNNEKTGIEIFISENLKSETKDCYVQGIVKNVSETENGIKIKLLVNSLSEDSDSYFYLDAKEYLFVYSDMSEVEYDDEIRIHTEIKLYENAMNEGSFNAYDYYNTRNISGYAYPTELKIIQSNEEISAGKVLYFLKSSLIKGLRTAFDNKEAGILIAVLTGERDYMNDDVRDIYQDTGFAHILAISGLHISIIGLSFFNLLRKKELGFISSTVLTLFILVIYNSFSGGQVSCIRSIIMICMSLISRCIGRKYDRFTALALAAIIILIKEPGYIYDSSFLMSFSAGLGIALFGENLDKCEILANERRKKNVKRLLFTLGIQVSLLPAQVQFFNSFCPYSIILNMLLLPLVPAIVVSGLVAGIAGCVLPFAGTVAGFPAKVILSVYESVLSVTRSLPFSNIITGHMTAFKWLVFAVVIISFYIIMYKKKTIHAFWCLLPAVFLIIPFKSKTLNISQIYVGQGDCCIITCGDTAVAVDCGSSDETELYKYTIEPYLNYYGYDELDYVFLSHSDMDHVSGIIEYLENSSDITKSEMICMIPDLEDISSFENLISCSLTTVKCYDKVNIGELVFTCIYPDDSGNSASDNETSMVLHMSYGDFSMLFTGDIGEDNEVHVLENLKEAGLDIDVDVLKVAHHGSNYSSSDEFLSAVTPELALISCGKNNLYGHPGDDAVERLRDCGSKVYVTRECGRIKVRTDKENDTLSYSVNTYLELTN